MLDRPKSRRRRVVVRVLLLAGVLALALGFLGAYAAPFDSLAHFRTHLALVVLLLAAVAGLLRLYPTAFVGAVSAGTALYTVAPYYMPLEVPPPANAPVYTLLQMNLRWNADDRIEAIRRVAEARPDIVTLQEMTQEWREALTPLEAAYPYQVRCENADGFSGDSAILSRRPFSAGTGAACDSGRSLALARFDLNGVAVTVASHHQLWPWPGEQWSRLDSLRQTLGVLPTPLVLAGDFNAAPWSALVQDYAASTGTRVVGGIGPTWFPERLPPEGGRYAGLQIDNILASPSVTILGTERPAATGSDHLPILVRFTVSPPQPEAPETEIVAR